MSSVASKRIGLLLAVALVSSTPAAAQQATTPARTGQQVYETICITCHGPEGKGGVNLELEKVIALPDRGFPR
jgi:mono/diheme cytochrome c family protein